MVLSLIEQAVAGEKFAGIFAATAQLAKQEKESFENILELFYSLLTDLLELSQGLKSSLLRNPDLTAGAGDPQQEDQPGVGTAGHTRHGHLESRLRRNVGRQLGLDAFIASLGVHAGSGAI